jgi:hypothetical protein
LEGDAGLEMITFTTSLALVLIAQIPLLLKLWLDYRSKTSALKQELHKRQIDAFQPLLAQLTKVHEGLEFIVRTFPDITRLNEPAKEFASRLYNSTSTANLELAEMTRDVDLLLPAELSIALNGYTGDTARIVTSAMGMPMAFDGVTFNIKTAWREQRARFGISLNLMRLCVGTDKLTTDVIREVHSARCATIVTRGDALDRPRFSLLNQSDPEMLPPVWPATPPE